MFTSSGLMMPTDRAPPDDPSLDIAKDTATHSQGDG
jgi:hypothetical protein